MSPVQYGVSEDCTSAGRDAMSTGKESSNFRLVLIFSQSRVTSPGKVQCVTLIIKAIRYTLTTITFSYLFIQNQQMHKNDHFIVMSSQTLLHVSVYQRHHQGAHMILTSYLYTSVHYMEELVPVGNVKLWIKVGMANHWWKQ
jgi:hypothetical protein